jgi:hypothetical protein
VPLAVLRFSPADLSIRYGLAFERRHDDLDEFQLAAIALPDGSQAWLERHCGDPSANALAHVDAGANLRLAKRDLQQVLDLSDDDFVWVSPLVGVIEGDADVSPDSSAAS